MMTSLERRCFSPRSAQVSSDQFRSVQVPGEKVTRPARPEVLAVVRAVFLHNEPDRTFFASAIWLLGNRLFNASVGTLRQADVRSTF